MTVANCITMARLILVPFFVYFFAVGDKGTAFVIFCIASCSDFIDGTVARLLNQMSEWGAILDPIADKLLLESSFLCLVITGVLPIWFFALALTRDLMIVFGIVFLEFRHIDFPHRAIWSSKIATFAQMVTIAFGLLWLWKPHIMLFEYNMQFYGEISMYISAFLIVISGALYVRRGLGLVSIGKAGS